MRYNTECTWIISNYYIINKNIIKQVIIVIWVEAGLREMVDIELHGNYYLKNLATLIFKISLDRKGTDS